MSARARAHLLRGIGAQPNWLGSEIPKKGFVPYCSEENCRHYDGKRCALTGNQPGAICVPAVERMAEVLDAVEDLIR